MNITPSILQENYTNRIDTIKTRQDFENFILINLPLHQIPSRMRFVESLQEVKVCVPKKYFKRWGCMLQALLNEYTSPVINVKVVELCTPMKAGKCEWESNL